MPLLTIRSQLGAGRIGFRVLQRLKPFDCKELLYFDYQALPEHAAKEVGCRRVEDLNDFLSQCDVLTISELARLMRERAT